MLAPGLTGGAEFTEPVEAKIAAPEGVVTLAWEGAEEGFVLEQSKSREFPEKGTRVRYRGLDRGSVITGLAEGFYFFRVRGEGSKEWSRVVEAEVKFMEKGRVVWLLILGGVVFLSTVGALGWGHFRSQKNGGTDGK